MLDAYLSIEVEGGDRNVVIYQGLSNYAAVYLKNIRVHKHWALTVLNVGNFF